MNATACQAVQLLSVLSLSTGPVQVVGLEGTAVLLAPVVSEWVDDGTAKGTFTHKVDHAAAWRIQPWILDGLLDRGLAKVEDRAEWGV